MSHFLLVKFADYRTYTTVLNEVSINIIVLAVGLIQLLLTDIFPDNSAIFIR